MYDYRGASNEILVDDREKGEDLIKGKNSYPKEPYSI
jgi:hypothetical protein